MLGTWLSVRLWPCPPGCELGGWLGLLFPKPWPRSWRISPWLVWKSMVSRFTFTVSEFTPSLWLSGQEVAGHRRMGGLVSETVVSRIPHGISWRAPTVAIDE